MARSAALTPATTLATDAWLEQPAGVRRIAEAAVEAFAANGYDATTTRDIASRAGLSPAALYVHFSSKAAVLGQISVIGHEESLALVTRALGVGGDPVTRLGTMAHDLIRWHADHAAVARIVGTEIRSLRDADRVHVAGVRRRMERLVEAEIRRGVAGRQLVVDSPRAATRAMLSLIVDVARWFRPDGHESAAQVATTYSRLALRMLGADLPQE